MTKQETYEEYVKKQYLEPKRIFGNLYFIGIRAVCTPLIDTGAELIKNGIIAFFAPLRHNTDKIYKQRVTLSR